MEFPITGSVSETDPQVLLRERYSDKAVVVVKDNTPYGSPDKYSEMTVGTVEYKIERLDQLTNTAARHRTAVENVKSILISELEDDNIDEDVAKQIADALGIELSRSVEVSVTVDFTLTLNIPYGSEVEDCVQDLNFTVETGYTHDCELESEDFYLSDWSEN